MKKHLSTFIFFISLLQAESLDNLLNLYEEENDLSQITKKEIAGNVIVYTKKDLERMKVSSLSELLKNIPFYRYNENKLGLTELLYDEKGNVTSGNNIRLYLNEMELTIPFTGNTSLILSHIDFDYINHIEIYYGSTSFEFGIEPAKIVIKAYTKDPTRENGGNLKFKIASQKSKEGSVSYAKVFDNFSLYAYANKKISNFEKLNFNEHSFSKDKESHHILLSLQNEHNRLEYNKIRLNTDRFIGGFINYPEKNETTYDYDAISWHSNWLENKLNLSLDYISLTNSEEEQADKRKYKSINKKILAKQENKKVENFPEDFAYKIPIYNRYSKMKESQWNAILKYNTQIKKHDLLIGTYLRYKKLAVDKLGEIHFEHISDNKNDLITRYDHENWLIYDKEKMYGVFFQDKYSLQDNQLLIASLKYDRLSTNSNQLKSDTVYFARLGYIYHEDSFSFKAFYNKYKTNFDFFTYTNNNDLSLELDWAKNKHNYTLNFFLEKEQVSEMIYEEQSLSPYYLKGLSFSHAYDFDIANKIYTNIFIANEKSDDIQKNDDFYGGYIRLFNSFGKLDLYNELIYRGFYENTNKHNFNLNFAATYKINRDFHIFLKGQNILNKAIKTNYYRYDINTQRDEKLENITVSPRRFTIGMEYKF